MDNIYLGGDIELGALEIGLHNDNTKDLSDGYFKMLLVMKDMLSDIIGKHAALRNEVCIIGYNIQDNNLSYMTMDIPAGYVTRVRRLQKLSYPTSKDDYKSRMPALLTITYNGFTSMNQTLSKIQASKSSIAPVIVDNKFILPPTMQPKSA